MSFYKYTITKSTSLYYNLLLILFLSSNLLLCDDLDNSKIINDGDSKSDESRSGNYVEENEDENKPDESRSDNYVEENEDENKPDESRSDNYVEENEDENKPDEPGSDNHVEGNKDEKYYEITFNNSWNREYNHIIPPGPHFSPVFAISHKVDFKLYVPGESIATDGLKEMAETGATGTLTKEIEKLIENGSVLHFIKGDGIISGTSSSPSRFSSTLRVRSTHPTVTIVSMIAPSPDWFIGIRDISLYENESFVSLKNVDVGHYDAGTDSGEEFEAPNRKTDPREPILKIALEGNPLVKEGAFATKPLGFFGFKKID